MSKSSRTPGISRIDQKAKHNHGFFVGCSAGAKHIRRSLPTKSTVGGNRRWRRPKSITAGCWRNGGRRHESGAVGGRRSRGARDRPASSACSRWCCGATARPGSIGKRPGARNRMSPGINYFRSGNSGRRKPGNWPFAPGAQDCETCKNALPALSNPHLCASFRERYSAL